LETAGDTSKVTHAHAHALSIGTKIDYLR